MDLSLRCLPGILFVILVTGAVSLPKVDGKDRVHHEKPLSDQDHFQDENHNFDYDHEAFLGDEAGEFDDLSPEESKNRLAELVTKIDANADGYVTQDELSSWIQYSSKRYLMDDVESQWRTHNPDDHPTVTWDEYKKYVYGFLEDEGVDDDDGHISYKDMMLRDERRWGLADKNQDQVLTKEEFGDFLHPEEAGHMRDIVVQETLEDIDKNKDGLIDLEEYIGDMYHSNPNEIEPDWVKTEREQFTTFRDKNGDGFLDKQEVKDWILPDEYNHSDAEAKHLIFESDADRDERLTLDEILDKYDLFVGSQATDFGEALTRHDEF